MSVEGVESNILLGESEDIATSLRAPTTPRFTPGRTKGYSDISGMILREAPYNSRMMPFHTTGLDKLSEKEQEILQEEILNAAAKSGRKKTKSDVAAMMALGFLDGGIDNVVPRKRQISSSDVVTKFGYAPQLGYEDLRLVRFCWC